MFRRAAAFMSTKAPVPSNVPKPVLPAHIISGVPEEMSARPVRIFRPANTTMQSGVHNSRFWKIDFDTEAKWENPLMGWASSGDPLQATSIKFPTKDSAVSFAEQQGYDYWIDEPKEPKFRVKQYASNYKYNPGKLRICHTK